MQRHIFMMNLENAREANTLLRGVRSVNWLLARRGNLGGFPSFEESQPWERASRDPTREQFWCETFSTWQVSGLTIHDFRRRHRLIETAFHYW